MNMNKNSQNHWIHAAKSLSPVLLAALLAAGCATSSVKPAYPVAQPGERTSVLRLDNTMADSAWAVQFLAPIALTITVDGFSPVEKAKLKSGGLIGQGSKFIPKGITEVHLPAGSHTLTHQGRILNNSPYRFDPVTMSFDTEEGKTYVIRFKAASKATKPRYAIEYEGWSKEQTSQWPNEVSIANPIFGR